MDTYELAIKPDAPRGEYTLEVGLYRAEDGGRLPAQAPALEVVDDAIRLGRVTITSRVPS